MIRQHNVSHYYSPYIYTFIDIYITQVKLISSDSAQQYSQNAGNNPFESGHTMICSRYIYQINRLVTHPHATRDGI